MRTAIFLGLVIIAGAINQDFLGNAPFLVKLGAMIFLLLFLWSDFVDSIKEK